MKISARNILKGKIVRIEEGVTTAVVKIEVASGVVITSIISKESVKDLKLKAGDQAFAVIKSTEVMIATP